MVLALGRSWRGRAVAVAAAALLCGLAAGLSTGVQAAAAKSRPAPHCDRIHFRVVVDVGHTVESPGATSARGVPEYEYNLRLATQIEQALIDLGFAQTVLLVTDGPAVPSLFKRVTQARALEADLFLSIHHDSVPESFLKTWQVDGIERPYSDAFKGHSIFVSFENGDPAGSLRFGRLLGTRMTAQGLQYTHHYTDAAMGRRRRQLVDAVAGVYRFDQLVVLRHARMAAVLLEAGSIINRDEELESGSPERRAAITNAVSGAVEEYCAAVRQPSVRSRSAKTLPTGGRTAAARPGPRSQQ